MLHRLLRVVYTRLRNLVGLPHWSDAGVTSSTACSQIWHLRSAWQRDVRDPRDLWANSRGPVARRVGTTQKAYVTLQVRN